MAITLREITEENWVECILLTTNKDNRHSVFEEFVASNALSIAQSKIERDWTIKSIFNDEKMVGFTMYGFNHKENYYELCRLMIDHNFQGKGFGKNALQLVLDEMITKLKCKRIHLSFEPENKIAKCLYESFGFKDTGRVISHIDEELIYCLEIK